MSFVQRVSVLTLLIVLLSVGFSFELSFSNLKYLTDGDRGIRRADFEDYWSRQVPIGIGLGGLAAITAVGLLRSLRRRSRDDAVVAVGVGSFGVMVLLTTITLFLQLRDFEPDNDQRRIPRQPYQVFTKARWLKLGEQPWQYEQLMGPNHAQVRRLRPRGQPWKDERLMGPAHAHGPGLRDLPGYVPFEPCLLKVFRFEGLARETVVRILGPPIPAIYERKQYLQYKMIEPSPRGRIANLVFSLEFTMERGQFVNRENLYPERITAGCSSESRSFIESRQSRDEEQFIPDLRSTGSISVEGSEE